MVHLTKQIWCDLLNFPTFARYQACLDQLALSTVPTVPSPTQTTQQAWPGQPDWHGTANLAGPAWPGSADPTQPPWLATHFAGVASLANLAGSRIVRRGVVPSTRHHPFIRKSCAVISSIAAPRRYVSQTLENHGAARDSLPAHHRPISTFSTKKFYTI